MRRLREDWKKHGLVRFDARKSKTKWEIEESEDRVVPSILILHVYSTLVPSKS